MAIRKKSNAIHVRPALGDDYGALVELWKGSGSGFRPNGRETREAFLRHLDRFADLTLVAVDGDQIIGVVVGSHDGRKGWINRLAVRPDRRRQGIAASLVMACDRAIRAEGIAIVAALVEDENDPSAALFRKLGYSDALKVRYFRKLSHPEA